MNGCAYNDEIKVGEYVRTHEGYIAKFKKYEKGQSSKCKLCIFDNSIRDISNIIYDEDNFLFDDELEEYIAKHSVNIMELIEAKDYVNGKKVYSIGTSIFNIPIVNFEDGTYETEQNIVSIVTHEQFEQMKYIVKE